MNILTFDIEEWALAKSGGYGSEGFYAKYNTHMDMILNALDLYGIKATFFCTGMMAREFPQIVKQIQSKGHDIGCHSHRHTWMNKMTEAEAREDTRAAVDVLEQCVGKKVFSYRAPAFSIGENNKWMFEILAENGIRCDASIFPANRDFGGFPNFASKMPCVIEYNGVRLKEFPVCTVRILGNELAYSGGGYFRFFPFWFIKKEMKNASYNMFYFHIGDLISESQSVMSKKSYEAYFKEPGTFKARYIRYFKSNFGKKSAWSKLEQLVGLGEFSNMIDSEKRIDWDMVPIVKL